MSDVRCVAVSCNGRNKLLRIPSPANLSRNRSDLQYLDTECRKLFSFSSNVHINLTFQKYNPEWEMDIDLDSDYVACNKDKLNLVVTPVLVDINTSTPAQSITSPLTEIGSSVCGGGMNHTNHFTDESECNDTPIRPPKSRLQKRSVYSRFQMNSDEEEGDLVCCRKNTPVISSDDEDCAMSIIQQATDGDEDDYFISETMPKLSEVSGSGCGSSAGSSNSMKSIMSSSVVCVKQFPKKQEKCLPDPFPLPEHFRDDVQVALNSRKMSRETTKHFYSAIANSMLFFKRYPTRDEYTRVAIEIIRKYPFLKPRVSGRSPTDGIVQTLINRFKQFNRKQRTGMTKPIEKNQSPENVLLKRKFVELPDIPVGEDAVSFERQKTRIQVEWKKSKVNMTIIEKLADNSFAMRRRDILENKTHTLETIYTEYPFLMNINQLYFEMGRVFNNKKICSHVRETWTSLSDKILEQIQVEKLTNTRLRKALHVLLPEDSEYNKYVAALCLLVYLLPDARMRGDHNLIIYFCPDYEANKQVVCEKGQVQPYILIIGELSSIEAAFLVIDCKVRYELEVDNLVFSLLSAFYVFNICYCKGTFNFFQFLEVVLLEQYPKKINPTVSHLLSMISSS